MLRGLGVGTRGEGHGSGTVRARFQQMGPVAVGSCRSGRQWRTTAAALGETGGTACSRRPSRTGLARVCGDVGLAGRWVSGRRRRQAGNGMACSRARARLNWSSPGQRRGRCRVNRRAERYYNDGWYESALGNPFPAIGQLVRQLPARSFSNTISAREPPYLMNRRCDTRGREQDTPPADRVASTD